MSSLWTPDGERPIRNDNNSSQLAGNSSQLAGSAEPNMRQPTQEEFDAMQDELRAMQEELSSVPAAAIVANHAVGLFQLAAVHLQVSPPNFADAQLAIDAMAAIVDGCRGRLGPDESTLVDALSQIRLAYVQMSAGLQG